MKEFDDFGHLSLIKINFQKSETLNILLREMESKSLNENFPFKWTSVSLKYLSTISNRGPFYTLCFKYPPAFGMYSSRSRPMNYGGILTV